MHEAHATSFETLENQGIHHWHRTRNSIFRKESLKKTRNRQGMSADGNVRAFL